MWEKINESNSKKSNNTSSRIEDKLGFLEATVDFVLKIPELRDDFIEFLKTKYDDVER